MNPLKTAIAPIGISKTTGEQISNTLSSALHFDTVVADGTGRITTTNTMPNFKPRIDDETSFLGHVKYCAEQGAAADPFSDPKFQSLCGMCMTEGSLLDGTQFTVPTGVVIYPEEKNTALEAKRKNGYPFSRVIPSYKAAICKGASKGSDARPSIALNSEEYILMKANTECSKIHAIGEKGCAQCLTTGNKSFIPDTAGIEPIQLVVYGSGSLDYTVGSLTGTVVLQTKKSTSIDLGKMEEGTPIRMTITRDTRLDGPYIAGFLQSITPRNAKFKLPIDRLTLSVEGSQGPPKKGKSFRSAEFGASIPYLYSPDRTATSVIITAHNPFTFIQPNEIAAFDCPTGPFMKKVSSASQFSKDPCLGQTDGSLSDACLRSKVEDNGCSAAGTLYTNPQEEGMGESILSFVNKVTNYANMSNTDREAAKKCTGAVFPTSCDSILSGGQPSNTCLADLYLNNLVESSFGSSYVDCPLAYTSINPLTKKTMYCQATGTLHPNRSGVLRTIYTNGYKGKTGLDGLRNFLTDTFNQATDDSLSPTVPDNQGGRKTSIEQCFATVPDLTPVEKPKEYVVFYLHCNYEGSYAIKDEGRYDMGDMGLPNDSISSIIIPDGCRVTVFEHGGFGGRSKVFTSNVPCLVDHVLAWGWVGGGWWWWAWGWWYAISWNDQISSFIIERY